MDIVKVNGKEIMVVEYHNQRVLLTEQVAQAYECDKQQIMQNFNYQQNRFTNGKHFIRLEGEELKEFKVSLGSSEISNNLKYAPFVYLWTRQGASRHCKMLNTDKAWDMFDCLEENYFNPPKQDDSMGELDMIIKLATLQKENNKRLAKVEDNITAIREVFKVRNPEDEWRDEVKHLIDLIVGSMGEGNTSEKYKMVVTTSYERLSSRASVNLNARLRNARKNYREIHNASESEAKVKVTKVQVIQKDKKIADIYLTILKEMAIQYGVVV